MAVTRRELLAVTAAAAGAGWTMRWAGAAAEKKIRVSGRTGSFGGKFENAKQAGLDGVELSVGRPADKLQIADPKHREDLKKELGALDLKVSSLSMDLLNRNPLQSEDRAPAWVEQTIEACQDFGATGILVPFFGKANLTKNKQLKEDAVSALVPRLKKLAPKAAAAGVTLGLECTLSAAQFLDILGRVGTDGVGAYYDIGNSTGAGLDVPGDLRALGKKLALIHFKDNPHYLGEGKVKMEPVAAALKDIDYSGWIVLETNCPSKDGAADCTRNVALVRKLMGL